MKVVKGDLIKMAKLGNFDAIVHGCNCFCNMGGGIAAQIKKEFPKAAYADEKTVVGDSNKLGRCQFVRVSDRLIIVNAYTQYDSGPCFQLDKLAWCLFEVKLNLSGCRIGLPKIGSGIGGGDWNKISRCIRQNLKDEDFTIVEYDA